MPRIRLIQLEDHAPWRSGEIVTVQVVEAAGAEYLCDTLETYPADLKVRHQADLEALTRDRQAAIDQVEDLHGRLLQVRPE